MGAAQRISTDFLTSVTPMLDSSTMLNVQSRALSALIILCTAHVLTGCYTVNDPLLGKAQATLKGCELGAPPELRADLDKAQAYLKTNQTTLNALNASKFFDASKAEAIKSLMVEYKGDTRSVERAYAYMSALPFHNDQLHSLTQEITQRLALMDKVREKSDYRARVKEQEKRVNDIAFAKETAELRQRLEQASVDSYNRQTGPDYIRHIQSNNTLGGSYTETTVKGHAREQVLESSKRFAAQEKILSADLARQEAEFSRSDISFAATKAYMSNESDLITQTAWPELKAVLSELDRLREAMPPTRRAP